jgi:hypothetical protein
VSRTIDESWARDLPRHERVKLALRLREAIYAAKNKPCADCRNLYPQGFGDVMTFDHLKAGKKLFDIGSIGVNDEGEIGHRLVPMKVLLQEIAKCEVVCLRCHKKREKRRQLDVRERRLWKAAFTGLELAMRTAWSLEQRDWRAAFRGLERVLRLTWALDEERRFQAARERSREASMSFTQSWRSGVSIQANRFALAFRPFHGAFAAEPAKVAAPPVGPVQSRRAADAYVVGRALRAISFPSDFFVA